VKAFQAQMAWLKKQGYQTITLARLSGSCRDKTLLPARPLIITFDDAYVSVFEWARPILAAVGFTATVFVVSRAVGRYNFWDDGQNLPRLTCLGISELRNLADAGWEIGSHGTEHLNMTDLSGEQLRRETADSKQELEKKLEQPVEVFAYPFGSWNEPARLAVQSAGYGAACAISPGTSSVTADLLALRRVYVKPTDSLWDFRRKVSPWYLSYRAWKKR
ncbi:polysaccharide deacetylase family protein, partial [bacterium]|nr:polysaccharide deacetylase family protein [bacterium]